MSDQEFELECPYCGNGLPDQQTACCGEVGHGVPIIATDPATRALAELQRRKIGGNHGR